MRRFCFVFLLWIFVFLLQTSPAQAYRTGGEEGQPFIIEVPDGPLIVKENTVEIDLVFYIPAKHHLYKKMFEVELNDSHLKLELELPSGLIKFDEFMNEETEVYEGDTFITLRVSRDGAQAWPGEIGGKLVFQGCSDRICFRAMTHFFRIKLLSTSSNQETNGTETKRSLQDWIRIQSIDTLLQQGIFFSLLIAFLAGFITAFTPCVLPIVPLTLSFVGALGEQSNSSQRLRRVLLFVLGLVVMNAGLGVLAASLGLRLGFIFQSPLFLLFLAVFMVVMGLWMLGVIQLQAPPQLQASIQKYQPLGIMRSFYAGMTIGLLALPCVGPIQAPLLVSISQKGNLQIGALMMLSYSLGLSVLFFFIAFFSRSWMQRAAGFTIWVKRAVALALFAVAAFYLSSLVQIWRSGEEDIGTHAGQDYFMSSFAQATDLAKKSNKPLLVDFAAAWCVPCHEWDEKVFSDPQVQSVLKNKFISVRVDCTQEAGQCKELVERYGIVGFPSLLFLSSEGSEWPDKRLIGIVLSAQEFIQHLNSMAP